MKKASLIAMVAAATIASALGGAQTADAEQEPGQEQKIPRTTIHPDGSYQVQIGAFNVREQAVSAWKRIWASSEDLLADLSPQVVGADLGRDKGIVYRLRTGPFADQAAAGELCSALQRRGVDCFVAQVPTRGNSANHTTAGFSTAPSIRAEAAPDAENDARWDEIRKLRAAYLEQSRQLEEMRMRLENLEEDMRLSVGPALYPLASIPASTDSSAAELAQGQVAQRGTDEDETPRQEEPAVRQQAPRVREQVEPAIQAIEDQSGALTPAGVLVVEPRMEYVNDSRNRVLLEGFTVIPAITVGNIDIREVDRDTLVGSVTGRYGVTERFEVDVNVPYVYRDQETTARPVGTGSSADETNNLRGDGLGDIQFAGHLQLNSGAEGWPFFIGNLNVRAPTGEDPFDVDLDEDGLEQELPTGSGFWGIEPSISMLYPSDPVVFWGTAGYLWNIEEEKNIQTTGENVDIDPGDALRFSIGMGVALNERTSFGIGYQHDYVLESEQDGDKLDGSDLQVGSLLLSGSYRISDMTSLSLQVNAGLTDDSPDVRVLFRLPIGIDLFR